MTRPVCGKCGHGLKEVSGSRFKMLLCVHCGAAEVVKSRGASPVRAEPPDHAPVPARPRARPAPVEDGSGAVSPPRPRGRFAGLTAFAAAALVVLALVGLTAVVTRRDGANAKGPEQVAEAPPTRTEPAVAPVEATPRPAAPAAERREEEEDPSPAEAPPPAPPAADPPVPKPSAAPRPAAAPAAPREEEPAPKADARSEAKLLQGKWWVWRLETTGGTECGAPDIPRSFLVFEDDTVKSLWGNVNEGWRGTFKVDPSKDPKEIEVTFKSGNDVGKKQTGIYRFQKKGQLEISWGEIGGTKVPRKFTGKLTPGGGRQYVTYRNDEYKDAPEIVREMKKLQGRWIVPGHPEGPVMIEDDAITWYWGGNQVGTAHRYTLDPSKDPKEIDLTCTQGYPGQRQVGIYRLKGETLEMSLSGIGADPKRPTKFADEKSSPGGGWMYVKYQLQEK